MRFDALLFDLDGTLVDSERVALESGDHAFRAMGHHDASPLLHSLIGVDQPTASERIRQALPAIDLVALQDLWSARFDEMMRHHVPLKPDVQALLGGLMQTHALALVTSSGRESALDRINRAGLAPSFRTVVTRDDVTAPKPAPDPYLLAAERLGAHPSRCLVFEDSEPGTEAAHRAGMTVVHVPDIVPASGRYSHHIARDIAAGLRWAGLLT
jgi:HAD superfamily hydrolase (TIGR01509 family)